ncbi:hypothetical protein Q9233_017715 [Columba guinea]|nr:hypothetical protein Q9233_017715 [Columba guinea]
MRRRWVALLVAALGAGAAALSLEPVVWHTGNQRAGGVSGYEWYKLYLVGGAQARSCRVPPGPAPLLTCDRPQRELRVTIKFQEFSPNLWGHEFRRMRDYYIISEE